LRTLAGRKAEETSTVTLLEFLAFP
jgi:hypothetical protein